MRSLYFCISHLSLFIYDKAHIFTKWIMLTDKIFSYILSNIQHIKKCFKWKLSILMIYLSANILFDEALWRLVCTAVSEHTSSYILAWPLISKIVLSTNTQLFHENSIKRIKQVTLVHFRWLVYIS